MTVAPGNAIRMLSQLQAILDLSAATPASDKRFPRDGRVFPKQRESWGFLLFKESFWGKEKYRLLFSATRLLLFAIQPTTQWRLCGGK